MNRETDRIPVPTNGRKPHPVADEPAQATELAPDAAHDHEPDADPTSRDPVAKATSPELTIAVSPAQLAVGFSVIAGIILLVLRRRRGRRRA